MTEEEIKFLEVIYKRGSLAEQAYINYVNACMARGTTSEKQQAQQVNHLFSRLEDSGLIAGLNQCGLYGITPLGKERFEALSENTRTMHRGSFFYSSRRRRFHLSRHVWIALAVVATVLSILINSLIYHWDILIDIIRKWVS